LTNQCKEGRKETHDEDPWMEGDDDDTILMTEKGEDRGNLKDDVALPCHTWLPSVGNNGRRQRRRRRDDGWWFLRGWLVVIM